MIKKPATAAKTGKSGARTAAKAKPVARTQAASKPKALTEPQMLDVVGIETISADIESGLTFGEIAAKHGVNLTALNRWMDKHCDISARARENSAEAWLDRGLGAIQSAMSKTGGIDAGAARAYAQECARRASIRNSKYRDHQSIDLNATIIPLTGEQRKAKIVELQAKAAHTPPTK